MRYTVIEASENKPSRIVIETESLGRAAGTLTVGIMLVAKEATKRGHRISITASGKRNVCLGEIYIDKDNRRGRAFAVEFDRQFTAIHDKIAKRLFSGKTTAIFVNSTASFVNRASVMFGQQLVSYTLVVTE